jgi:hypothetical protein
VDQGDLRFEILPAAGVERASRDFFSEPHNAFIGLYLQNQEVFATDVGWLVLKDHGFDICDFQLDLLDGPVIYGMANGGRG